MAGSLGIGAEEGQTPLDPDEAADLRLPVTTRGALNEVEAENIASASAWIRRARLSPQRVLTEGFVTDLHRRMFGEVWGWAGSYRRSDTNIGVPWTEIPVEIRVVLGDTAAWLASGMDPDEAAVRFGHRLVSVHPFPNGNGRHSRAASDCLAKALGRRTFTWGLGGPPAETRARYRACLREADRGDVAPLVTFARSHGQVG